MSVNSLSEHQRYPMIRSHSINDALLNARPRIETDTDPFLNVDYSCYVRPPLIEKWKYIKHKQQPKVNLNQPEALPPLVYIRSSWIDPAAIGIFGFGFGALLQCLQHLVPKYNANGGLTYVILLPGGLQVLSGWVDIQRGSYFGGIVFLGYGSIIIGNGLSLLLSVLIDPIKQEFNTFIEVADIGAIAFTVGALLIAINMSAVYSLLLLLTLSAFILETIYAYYSYSEIPTGVAWGVITVLAIYIFLAEIVNTVAERHVVPLGNALFNYKTMRFQNPFKFSFS